MATHSLSTCDRSLSPPTLHAARVTAVDVMLNNNRFCLYSGTAKPTARVSALLEPEVRGGII